MSSKRTFADNRTSKISEFKENNNCKNVVKKSIRKRQAPSIDGKSSLQQDSQKNDVNFFHSTSKRVRFLINTKNDDIKNDSNILKSSSKISDKTNKNNVNECYKEDIKVFDRLPKVVSKVFCDNLFLNKSQITPISNSKSMKGSTRDIGIRNTSPLRSKQFLKLKDFTDISIISDKENIFPEIVLSKNKVSKKNIFTTFDFGPNPPVYKDRSITKKRKSSELISDKKTLKVSCENDRKLKRYNTF